MLTLTVFVEVFQTKRPRWPTPTLLVSSRVGFTRANICIVSFTVPFSAMPAIGLDIWVINSRIDVVNHVRFESLSSGYVVLLDAVARRRVTWPMKTVFLW